MSFTSLNADKQKTYHGIVENSKGLVFKYKLPKVYDSGCVFRAIKTTNYIRIVVNSSNSNQESLVLKVQSRGVTYHDLNLVLKKGSVNLAIDNKSLPEGIIKFTVLNKDKQPICQRLFYHSKDGNRLQITAKTHLNYYSQRDKTSINLTTKDTEGSALSANLSVLVLNKEQLGEMHEKREHILSYFLLNSELKGAIEKPAYYFNEKNKFRYRDLDALMLTQGWRNYIYQDSPSRTLFKIKPEKGLEVTRTIGEFFNSRRKPKKPIELMMITFGESQEVLTQKTDSIGRFNFYLGDNYTDALEILIQSKSGTGKKKNYTVNIDKKVAPPINYSKQEQLQLADTINTYI